MLFIVSYLNYAQRVHGTLNSKYNNLPPEIQKIQDDYEGRITVQNAVEYLADIETVLSVFGIGKNLHEAVVAIQNGEAFAEPLLEAAVNGIELLSNIDFAGTILGTIIKNSVGLD
jgi:hypothetical protein